MACNSSSLFLATGKNLPMFKKKI